MKVANITRTVIDEGSHTGTPVVLVTFSEEADAKDFNQVVTKVKELGLPDILIEGTLQKMPEIRDLIVGLSSIGKRVIFKTDAEDDVAPIRPTPNLRFYLNAVVPSETKTGIKVSNLNLLIETDELAFPIASMEDYERTKAFLKQSSFNKPVVLFSLSEKYEGDVKELINTYLEDSNEYSMRTKISVKL